MSGIRVVTSLDELDTSVVLDSLDTDLILGEKYPLLKKPSIIEWDKKNETKGDFFLRMENLNSDPSRRDNLVKEEERKKQVHVSEKPHGYWDNVFTNSGIYYNIRNIDLLETIRSIPFYENYICKMSYEGLVRSDPRYIYKVVLILRYPHGKKERAFFERTRDLCKWVLLNQEVDVHVIDYDDMVNSIDRVNTRLGAVLGLDVNIKDIPPYGDVPENKIKTICDLIKEKKIDDAYEIILTELEQRDRAGRSWKCHRTGKKTTEEQCKLCKDNSEFRDTLKKRAIKSQLDWSHQPCLYECGKNPDVEPITFETSIKNNFWA